MKIEKRIITAEEFDECAFANRKDWRIFLEVGSQPN